MSSQKRVTIPDLRVSYNDQFTLDHCSVLLDELNECLHKIYPDESFDEVIDQANTVQMLNDLLSMMRPEQLNVLFSTPIGKGFIIGCFFTEFVLPQMVSDELAEIEY